MLQSSQGSSECKNEDHLQVMTAFQSRSLDFLHEDGKDAKDLQKITVERQPHEDRDTAKHIINVNGLQCTDHDRHVPSRDLSSISQTQPLGSEAYSTTGHISHREHSSADRHSWQKGVVGLGPSVFDTPANETSVVNGDRSFLQSDIPNDGYDRTKHSVSKLSPEQLRELTHSPESLPLRALTPEPKILSLDGNISPIRLPRVADVPLERSNSSTRIPLSPVSNPSNSPTPVEGDSIRARKLTIDTTMNANLRPSQPQRALSTPASIRGMPSPRRTEKLKPGSINIDEANKGEKARLKAPPTFSRSLPSPMPKSFPLPPLSIPTYLQLELSSHRPSQLYIHRSANSDFPYESSRVKIERLLNFLFLPFHLEAVLLFGMLACVDSWLYTFTILPLRLLKSFYILGQSWMANLVTEAHFVSQFIYNGTGRMWRRRRTRSLLERKVSESEVTPVVSNDGSSLKKSRAFRHHHRSKSVPSMLLPDDKADILKGLLIICTTLVLLRFDASRMYHWVRGQAAIKLYVIYNILEVCDRLFSAIGQDVLECLFSKEALERKEDGRSKLKRPFWLFVLALVYTVIHSTALFYQVITLNVAVNSYSNALITLLLSNQFVEIKSTVFKKFEKENLFQLTCADVVERFQLWHMLLIIASRNIVETGGLTMGFSAFSAASTTLAATQATNSSIPVTPAVPPLTVSSILPKSFTIVPGVIKSITSYVPIVNHVIGPFLIVMGSEMLVDWLKHAYINKFNNTRPAIYDRFLDVLAKDYYTNAFGDQNLTKRLGLPVIPLSCLLIRAAVQIYQMFIAVWVPSGSPSSLTTLATIHEQYSSSLGPKTSSTSAAIARRVDDLLGGLPSVIMDSTFTSTFTTILVLMLIFMVLLACKLVLGMLLLAFARARYRSMKEREKNSIHQVEGGKRVGGWGVVEVGEDKRRWIYEDDPNGLQALQDRENRDRMKREKERDAGVGANAFERVVRYELAGKRIW